MAQGCRPIGEPMLLTQVRNNLALELGQKAPLEVMRELHARLDERDQALFHHSLFLGIEMRDQLEYAGGDFLIRNVLGIEPKSGGLVVGARLEPWKAVQFHLRDGEASAADLAARLDRAKEAISAPPAAALLFSCLGRGEGLYGIPHHDTRLIRARFDGVPVGGFFCNGEIGPVGGDTFLHGYTSAIALISPA
ncbi:MAG: FIST C-terminal domain-containing protein [Myxococcota bacterium]